MDEYIEKGVALYLLGNLAKEPAYQHDGEDYYVGICEASGVINEIQPSDVTPVRHAKWSVNVGMNFFKERNCPVCKKRIESNFWNYCPNCGADMRGSNGE